jgi:hypothetical protein
MRRTALLALVVLLGSACGLPQPPVDDPRAVFVTVEVLEDDVPVIVDVSAIRLETGLLRHEVRVLWDGDGPAVLSDARFTHRVVGEEGELLISGRGCGWHWSEEEEEFAGVCTDDLQIIEVEPGEVHDYPVAIHPEVGPARFGFGIYVVEEAISWGHRGDGEFPDSPDDGTFTIRLTYEVPG